MKLILNLVFSIIALNCVCTNAQNTSVNWSVEKSKLPICQGKKVEAWTFCQGTHISPGGFIYRGEFFQGKYSGIGALYFQGGARYIGNFHEGKYSGFGIFFYQNGDIYKGDWRDGYRHGLGSYESSDVMHTREGVWEQDKFKHTEKLSSVVIDIANYVLSNGVQNVNKLPSCKFTTLNVQLDRDRLKSLHVCWGFHKYRDDQKRKGDFFEGEWRNGVPHGHGVYFFSNGDKYEGDLKDGLRHGEGFQSYAKGGYYTGAWYQDQYDGTGMVVYPNGDYYFGQHKAGSRHGIGTYTTLAGKNTEGIWEKGKLVKNENVTNLVRSKNPSILMKYSESNSVKNSLQVISSAPDKNGQITITVQVAYPISSLTINGEEHGSRQAGKYEIKKIVRVSQGTEFIVNVVDANGRSDTRTITVHRKAIEQDVEFANLNPENIKPKSYRDAVAIIIGISDYKSLPKADFAKDDAQVFYDYAIRALGVKPGNIRILLDADADEVEIFKAFKTWLPARVKSSTDVYVFYSGHGLPDQNGQGLYILPHRADRDLISRTAIQLQEISADIQAAKPKSVTVFLDACYSGQTRTGETLIVGARPLALKAQTSVFPSSFNVITASQSDQISSSSQDIRHGIFSYYLMKGMEGGADFDGDGRITLGEMQQYLSENVVRHAGSMNRKQNPQFFGNPTDVLVRK